jgi:hypothetical protein
VSPEPLARIDRASGIAHRRWLELLADEPGNPLAVQVWLHDAVTATVAATAPEVQWMQHVHGAVGDDADLVEDLCQRYVDLGLRPRFELAPSDGFERLAAVLARAGARQTSFLDVLGGSPSAPGERPHASHVRVTRLPAVPSDRFGATLLAGHEVPIDAHPANVAAAARFPTLDDYRCYLAEDTVSGRTLGAAVLVTADGVGLLANASTLPAARQRGVQAALIARRIADAYEAGCDVVGSVAVPWSTSQRNLRRAGLSVTATKVVWTVPAG